jgi:hypothetical protein
MISINRVLPFDEYALATKLALLHSTRARRIRFFLNMRIFPALAILIVPLSVWLAINDWNEPGDHGGAFALQLGLAAYGAIMLYCPFSFRRKIRKLYEQQGFHQDWLVEVSEKGIHSAIPSQADSQLEWNYFDSCVETAGLFVMIRSSTGTFISLPKSLLDRPEQEELRQLISAHHPLTSV